MNEEGMDEGAIAKRELKRIGCVWIVANVRLFVGVGYITEGFAVGLRIEGEPRWRAEGRQRTKANVARFYI